MVRRETENNAYAKFWGDKQRALWYVMVFSGVANCLAVPVLKKNLKFGHFTSWSCSGGREMYKKAWCTCSVVVLLTNCLLLFDDAVAVVVL